MTQLNNFVSTHLGAVGLAIIVGCVVLLLMIGMLFVQSRRIALLSARLDGLTQGVDGESLEGVLDAHLETVVRVAADLEDVQVRIGMLEAGARLQFARLGLVRFNPFDDTGGNQSFALAMLDANNDGFVVTSLHSRNGTRLYAKAVFGGEAESTLGAEEARAVEIAVSQGSVGSAAPTSERRVGTRAAGRTKTVPSYAQVPESDEAVLPREAVVPSAVSLPRQAAEPTVVVKQTAPAPAAVVKAARKTSAPNPAPIAAPKPAPKAARPPRVQTVTPEVELEAEPVDTAPSSRS